MNLRQLHHFVLVAEQRNFRRAAKRANLSQPALSHSIKALEESLDVQLFERSKHSVVLTSVGEALLNRARRVLFETDNFREELENLKTGGAGHLRVGLVPTFAYSFGGRAISEWMSNRPGVSIEAFYQTSQSLTSMLQEDEIDFFVCDMRQVSSSAEIDVTPIGVFQGGLFCRAGHPILEKPKVTTRDLLEFGFASVRMPATMRNALAAQFSADGRNKPFLALECDAITVLRETVLATDMIWLANIMNVTHDVAEGRLVRIEFSLTLEIHWGIAKRRDRVLPPAAYPLIELLTALPLEALHQTL